MKIIKRGVVQNRVRCFRCVFCKTIFLADKHEYSSVFDPIEQKQIYFAVCPVCNGVVQGSYEFQGQEERPDAEEEENSDGCC